MNKHLQSYIQKIFIFESELLWLQMATIFGYGQMQQYKN